MVTDDYFVGALIKSVAATRLCETVEMLLHGVFTHEAINASECAIIVDMAYGIRSVSVNNISLEVLTAYGVGWTWAGLWMPV